MSIILAADTGGTFTDLVGHDQDTGRVVYAKSLTTYDNLIQGIINCAEDAEIPFSRTDLVKHGTTLVINALLQRDGARIASVSSTGFRDVIEIGRGNRPSPFKLDYRRHEPLVPRHLRFEVSGRIDGRGQEIAPIDTAEVEALADHLLTLDVDAIAVSLVNSYLNPDHEAQVTEILRSRMPEVFVTMGAELSREWYEYERTSTAVANAFVGPKLARYVRSCRDDLAALGFKRSFYLMGSNGGVLSLDRARREPVTLVESGPVGGCIGASVYASALDIPNLIAFDMGGTTAKAAVIEKGELETRSPYYIGGYEDGFPIRSGVIDIVEVGAGGGSIAWLDPQNRLKVGPLSAGSTPGPAAFGKGGTKPTVLDANLVLGRVGHDTFLNGKLQLDKEAARRAIVNDISDPLGFAGANAVTDAAKGIIGFAVAEMTSVIKQVTVERGLDPRDFSLFVYGGSGPLHGSLLARELRIPVVIVPPEPGNYSAIGMLLADARRDVSQTTVRAFDTDALKDAAGQYAAMEEEARSELVEEVGDAELRVSRQLELRFKGQSHSLRIPVDADDIEPLGVLEERFYDAYRRRYGRVDETAAIQLVGIHCSVHGRTPAPPIASLKGDLPDDATPEAGRRMVHMGDQTHPVEAHVYKRGDLPVGFAAKGPAIVEEYGSTTLIGPGDSFEIGALGEIRIDCSQTLMGDA
ncbi:hydantoinase/oxoprolinase family protein [Pseudooceanicola sp. MF1-13]|uniref:hydantoinase/oxoprolinase family protein n=1 Tax=Pseudooceanicola sp. MF1-13 TaxID=3379095 RepID=UPI0038927222